MIWDDAFAFDELPLNISTLKICLFLLPNGGGSPSSVNLSTTALVNNFIKTRLANVVISASPASSISSLGASKSSTEPILIGTVHIKLSSLLNNGLCESWYTLEPVVALSNASSASGCNIRIKLCFSEDKVALIRHHYDPLADFLLRPDFHRHLCIVYERLVSATDRAHLVNALLRLCVVRRRVVTTLRSFLFAEIERCRDLSTLFRPASLCTALLDAYMRMRCLPFLRYSLEDTLKVILSRKHLQASTGKSNSSSSFASLVSFELDPSKCEEQTQRALNLEALKEALRVLISTICSPKSVHLFPNELKYLFFAVRRAVQAKCNESGQQSEQFDNNKVTFCLHNKILFKYSFVFC